MTAPRRATFLAALALALALALDCLTGRRWPKKEQRDEQ